MNDKSQIAKAQCERTAREYYSFRMAGGTANDLVEIPAMRRLLDSVRGTRVVDCGCGFGTHSIWCAKHGASVVGIDISETMIDLARQAALEAGVEVDFRVGDMTDLREISPGTFDIAISSNAVCFDIPRFFGEVARVLRPRGSFLLCEVHPAANLKYGDYFDRSMSDPIGCPGSARRVPVSSVRCRGVLHVALGAQTADDTGMREDRLPPGCPVSRGSRSPVGAEGLLRQRVLGQEATR